MSVTQFLKDVAAKGYGPGARWLKADFHVHLPSSDDYTYKSEDAYTRLGASLESARVNLAVVLKHEAFTTKAEVAKLQPHCPSVTLIPGAEINVLVDALFKKIGRDYYFHCIVAGDPDDNDEYGYVLRTARDKLQYRPGAYPTGFRSSIVDVANEFRKAGALFIPAHLHQGKAPETSRSVDDLYDDDAFLGFIRDGAFDAVEVRDTKTAVFFDGEHKTQEDISIPQISCVRSSDAHHHDDIGRGRSTWIRMENRTFGELKAALALPHRVTLTRPEVTHARVVGLHIVGAFIRDTWLQLNESLNALIGSKGAGKTAVMECLRFVLNTAVPKERLEDVNKHRQHILGSSGYVECLIQDLQGKHTLVVRRADSSDRITVTSEEAESITVMASAGQVFPISILGWHEIESVADRAAARIGILDRAGQPESVGRTYSQIADHIAQSRDALPLLQRQVRRLDKSLTTLWELRRKRSTLSRLAEGALSQLQDQYDWYLKAEERLQAIAAAATSRRIQLPELLPSRIDTMIASSADGASLGALKDALIEMEKRALESRQAESTSTNSLDAALQALATQAEQSASILSTTFVSFREETYAPAVAGLSPDDREILTKQIQVLEETKKLPSVESSCTEQLRELRSLAEQLHSSCVQVCKLRDEIAKSRSALVDTLNEELPGVRLEFRRSADKEARNRFQGSYPSDGPALIGFVDRYAGHDGYEKLCDLFSKLQSLDIDQDKWTIEGQLLDAKFVDLLEVIDDDDVEISLEVGKRGFVPIQNLSAGQRCVAVFPLLLRNSRGPLVIDQPEDNLDNRYIADSIAPDLLNKKRGQQFLLTSHNANLVVLTDADLIFHIDSDGTQSDIPAAGFLAWRRSAIKDAVLGVLDGGEAALIARQKKYGV